MDDKDLFEAATFNTVKVSAVAVSATSDASPDTIATLVTPSLPAGWYWIGYSFEVTHSAKNQPAYFKLSGTYTDDNYFSNSASDSDETNLNRQYGYPKDFAGGVITMNMLAYKPTGTVVFDFCDLFVHRVG